jgi:hypothetical protein
MYRLISILLIVTLAVLPLLSQPASSRVQELVSQAYENHKRIEVTLNDGTSATGTVTSVDEKGFTLATKKGEARAIAFDDVREARKKWMSTGMKVGIGVGIGAAVVIVAVVIALSRSSIGRSVL